MMRQFLSGRRLVAFTCSAAIASAAQNPAPLEPSATTDAPDTDSEVTVITARGSDFDQHEHRAIFLREVFVKNPQFNLSCDKLTAFRKAQPPADSSANRAPAHKGWPKAGEVEAPPPIAEKAPKDSTGGIEKAIAEGSVIITQDKVEADGRITHSIGHSRRAVYEASTGDITMTGMPRCEQTDNTCVGTTEGTIIILNRAGQMRAIGPHRMFIRHVDAGPASKKSATTTETGTARATE